MTTASTVLPIMGYFVGSVLVAYIAIRAYRHVRQRSSDHSVLPRPVYETASRKSPFSFVGTKGRPWHMWKLPVPWTRSPTASSSSKTKAASIASGKGLSVELLPTTALPPPPTSIPTSPPLVDLNTPAALEASAASRFSVSLPPSPKRQSRPLWQQHPSSPPHLLKGHINIHHPAFPRPPSPHALLATTPPQRHTRSRSLGGVPVRRLSSGQSGLRNKVDVELHDFVPGHSRRSSEEHLLIDFSSTSDGHVSTSKDDPATISPAASDIGVLPPSTIDNKVVNPRPMPLVDIGDDSNMASTDRNSEPDNTSWMWFNSNPPSTIRSYDPRILAPRPQAALFSGVGKFTFPLPLPFPKAEKIIDIPPGEDASLELDSLDSSSTLRDIESDLLGKEVHAPPIVPYNMSVDVGISQTVFIDPFSDDYAVDYVPHVSHAPFDDHPKGGPVQNDRTSPNSFIDIEGDKFRKSSSPTYPPPVDEDVEASAEAGLVFINSQILPETNPSSTLGDSPWVSVGPNLPSTILSTVSTVDFSNPSSAPGREQTDWRWVDADDTWGDHISVENTLDPNYDGVDWHLEPVMLDHLGEKGLTESSPGGSLLATVLNGEASDDEVPHLSLDGPPSSEELLLSRVVPGQIDDEDEEDATPRPTPVSADIQLPGSDDGVALPTISVEDQTDDIALENTQPVEQLIADNYPDPDLLPLPEFSPPSAVAIDSESGSLKAEPRPSSQMPTPPASPPPSFSPALAIQRRLGKSLPSSPKAKPQSLSVTSNLPGSRSRSTSPLTLQVTLPAVSSREENGDQGISLPAESGETPHGHAEKDVQETSKEVIEPDGIEEPKGSPIEDETPLPGSLPEILSTSSSVGSSKISQTVAARLAEKSMPTPFHPSVRAIVRQPVEIALAMQLRPGLGAGADPAWMVRFLMAMFGWFAVLVSGQENY